MSYPQNFTQVFQLASDKKNERNTFIEAPLSRVTYKETCLLIGKLSTLFDMWGLRPGSILEKMERGI